MTTKLSVNINKIATLRNARGSNNPNLLEAVQRCESFGAQGITIHPRPDERHIRYNDVYALKPLVKTEFNIEGNPTQEFIDLVLEIQPHQVTLVPDLPDALTSNAGWDCIRNGKQLQKIIQQLHNEGIRTSIFLDPMIDQVKAAKDTGTDRIELYTERYALQFGSNPEEAIKPYLLASEEAQKNGLGLNAGHDLDLNNLGYFQKNVENLLEVSIGHALICDALYMGMHNAIVAYLNCLNPEY
ncbi:MAG: pyridoxine 5-phosphate synthase [Bacteroidia bacterium]|jgi:pyridoxine 5-phosphate synthase